ncbi:catechol 2,3-dioxygenase-like lactoylglutathione lyase family enzyme, partial [Phyllobacterium brassicacearum]
MGGPTEPIPERSAILRKALITSGAIARKSLTSTCRIEKTTPSTIPVISCDTSRLVGRFVHDEPNPLVYTCKLQTQSVPWGVKMKPRIKVLTLGVDDLDRSLAFYRDGMGLETKGIIGQQFEDGAVVFFYMNDDLILALWPTASLSRDAKIAATQSRLGAVSIGHIVNSREEVDSIIRQAEQAGAVVTDPPHDRFWGGYSGYFRDPD